MKLKCDRCKKPITPKQAFLTMVTFTVYSERVNKGRLLRMCKICEMKLLEDLSNKRIYFLFKNICV
jgi:hypothetical protein